MFAAGSAPRLMILMDEDRTRNHRPIVDEIIHRAHDAGLSGASACGEAEGFGASQHGYTQSHVDLSDKSLMMVDGRDNIGQFRTPLDDLEIGGVMTVDDVEIVGSGVAGAGPR